MQKLSAYFLPVTLEFLSILADYDYDFDLLDDFNTTTISVEEASAANFNDDDLANFLMWPEYDFWSGFVQLQNVTADGKFVLKFI